MFDKYFFEIYNWDNSTILILTHVESVFLIGYGE